MNVLSEFDGISCGQLALQRAGIFVENYYASEIDKYAIQIAKKNFPKTVHLGNVLGWKSWDLPKIDLFIAGSPCQGFSNAGKGLNFDDPRSKLFFEFVDTLKMLRDKNPDLIFMLENVRMKQEWQDIISEQLGVKPIKINSALVSAQNRVRLYWTNIQGITQPEDKSLFWKDIMELDAKNVFYYTSKSFEWINKSEYRRNKFKIYTIKTNEKMQMVEAMHYKGYSNQRCFGIKDITGKIRYISPLECERLQTLPDGYTGGVSNTQRYKCVGNGWTVDVIKHIFSFIGK